MFILCVSQPRGFPGGSMVKNPSAKAGEMQVWSLSKEYPLEKEWQTTQYFLPGKSHGQRSLRSTVSGVTKESDTTTILGHGISLFSNHLKTTYKFYNKNLIFFKVQYLSSIVFLSKCYIESNLGNKAQYSLCKNRFIIPIGAKRRVIYFFNHVNL